jgi:energy-converting hydrogenase Eha subunit B
MDFVLPGLSREDNIFSSFVSWIGERSCGKAGYAGVAPLVMHGGQATWLYFF